MRSRLTIPVKILYNINGSMRGARDRGVIMGSSDVDGIWVCSRKETRSSSSSRKEKCC